MRDVVRIEAEWIGPKATVIEPWSQQRRNLRVVLKLVGHRVLRALRIVP